MGHITGLDQTCGPCSAAITGSNLFLKTPVEEVVLRTCHLVLALILKSYKFRKATILSKLCFVFSRKHKDIFNIFVATVQRFRTIA